VVYDMTGQSSYGSIPTGGPPLPGPPAEGATAPGWYRGHKLANGFQRLGAAFIDYYVPFLVAGVVVNMFHGGALLLLATWWALTAVTIVLPSYERAESRDDTTVEIDGQTYTVPGLTPPLDGQTLGKWALGLTAVQPRMEVATHLSYFRETDVWLLVLRALLHLVSFPILPLSVLCIFLSPGRQSFCDRLTKTLVVASRPSKIERLRPPPARVGGGPKPPPTVPAI
jgi:hypothetical protein